LIEGKSLVELQIIYSLAQFLRWRVMIKHVDTLSIGTGVRAS